ncbi:MAG: type IV secretory system conjugative DNA transfer family protein [Alphaproteobacteria bacterium]|nr:type IV secretory system conjugative DNA transfer family protein [Alphaproteobacteria bacterium]
MFNKKLICAQVAWATLPIALTLAYLFAPLGRYLVPFFMVLPMVPFFPQADAQVVNGVTAAAGLASILAVALAVDVLRRDKILPSWALAPVALAVVVVGLGHLAAAAYPFIASSSLFGAVWRAGVGVAAVAVAAAFLAIKLLSARPIPTTTTQVKPPRDLDPDAPWQAHWWPMADARQYLSDPNGLVLGEACLPAIEPEMSGIAPLLKWRPDGHVLTAAGSGAGKGVSVVVPNCLGWSGPLIVHDPAGETLAMVRAHREGLGRTVRVVSLEADTDGVNVLAWLDSTKKTFVTDARTVVSWLDAGENGGTEDDSSFMGLARTLTSTLIMFVVASPEVPAKDKTLAKVRELGASLNLEDFLRTLVGQKHLGGGAVSRGAGIVLRTMKSEETFSGVNMNFDALTAPIDGNEEILCGHVCDEKRFNLADIIEGDTDFFISIPTDVLDSCPQAARILLGSLATMFLRSLKRVEHDTLFIVDEMPRLGRLQVLATARDVARKYGLYVWAIVQDLGQLEEAYKKTGVRSWLASPAVLQFFGVNDLETAEMLCKRCEKYTGHQKSTSTSRGRNNGRGGGGSTSVTTSESYQQTPVELISISEIMAMATDEEGRAIG